ncbi:hypothetical protein ACET3Z_018041 [Daucus carota]
MVYPDLMKSESNCIQIPGPLIIGAGPSGLAAAACLRRKGVPFFIVEKESCLASLWKLKTYDRLKLHLPKEFCQLPCMPFPQEFPAYPTKQQFITYLEAYANHFSITPRYGEGVQWAHYDPAKRLWHVRADKAVYLCRWLIVATGENAVPVLPNIAGLQDFGGRILHTSEYKNGDEHRGRKVLVVGCGNSGMEISLDLCNYDAQVSLVVRHELHVLPKEMLGKSTIALSMHLIKWLPLRFVDWLLILSSWLIHGDTSRRGIVRPKTGPLQLKEATGRTPVLDVGSMAKINTGEIKVVRGIKKFIPNGVEFEGGRTEGFDTVILATGYRSNVASWLKEEDFISGKDGNSENTFPKGWKGENGIYSVGFSRQGLLGISIDAQRVAEDIVGQWKS